MRSTGQKRSTSQLKEYLAFRLFLNVTWPWLYPQHPHDKQTVCAREQDSYHNTDNTKYTTRYGQHDLTPHVRY